MGYQSNTALWSPSKKSNGVQCCTHRSGQSYLRSRFLLTSPWNHSQRPTSCQYDSRRLQCKENTRCSCHTCFLECRQTRTKYNDFQRGQQKNRCWRMKCECNRENRSHQLESYKWHASEGKHPGWTSYGTLTGGSCSIQVHFGWLACRTGRTVCPWIHYCFAKSGTGSESMRNQAQSQSRSRLGMSCCAGRRCCRCHLLLFFSASWCLCMNAEVKGIGICVRWRAEYTCSWIVFCSYRTRHGMCRHFDRGRSHSNGFDNLDQNRSFGELPMKKETIWHL